jgi:hypothetical protein
MEKKQIFGVIFFTATVIIVLMILGHGIVFILTKLGLVSTALIAAIKFFGFIFMVLVLIPVGLLALFLRGWVWTFKETVLTMHDVSDWLYQRKQAKNK